MIGLGLGLQAGASLGGASGPKITNNIVAANRTVTPGSVSAAITVPFTYYSQHCASPEGDISSLQFIDLGWYWFDNGTIIVPTNIGGTYTFDRFVEYPINSGVFTQVQSGAVVADGGQLKSTASIGPTILKGAAFGVRTVITAVTGAGVVPLHAIPAAPSVLGLFEGSQAGSFGNSGTVPVSASGADRFGPAAIMGTVAKAGARAHAIVGDSITAIGQGDTLSTGPNGGNGWMARALDPVCAYTRIGRQSISAKDIAAGGSKLTTLIGALGYSHVGAFLGTNDFNARYNRTAAQCSTDCGTIMGMFSNTGVTKYQGTVGGNSTSSDGFKTAGNQTANATQLAQVPTFNPAVRAIPAYLNGGFVVDYGAFAVPVIDNCKWRAPYVMTADGTHPNSYAHNWIANQARPALGGVYLAEAETTAFFSASTAAGNPAPIATWLDDYNSLIFMAKQNGWWSQASKIHLYNGYDRGVARRNIKRDGDHQSESGTVGWAAKTGFSTLGTGKLTSTYNPTTAADGLLTQNSLHAALGIATNEAISNGAADYALWSAAGTFFTSRNNANVAQGRANCAGNQATAATVTDSTGDWAFTRTAATTTNIYRNGTSLVTSASASIAVVSATEELGGLGAAFTNKTFSYMTVGAGLSAGQIGNLKYDMNCFNSVAQGL
jgi:lysophospholipase L1-like esterase